MIQNAMERTLPFLTCSILLMFAACKDEPKPQPPPEPPPAQPEPQGTTISAGEDGLEVRTEDGSIDVSPDSLHIDVKPK